MIMVLVYFFLFCFVGMSPMVKKADQHRTWTPYKYNKDWYIQACRTSLLPFQLKNTCISLSCFFAACQSTFKSNRDHELRRNYISITNKSAWWLFRICFTLSNSRGSSPPYSQPRIILLYQALGRPLQHLLISANNKRDKESRLTLGEFL